jgi:hypothetical protein
MYDNDNPTTYGREPVANFSGGFFFFCSALGFYESLPQLRQRFTRNHQLIRDVNHLGGKLHLSSFAVLSNVFETLLRVVPSEQKEFRVSPNPASIARFIANSIAHHNCRQSTTTFIACACAGFDNYPRRSPRTIVSSNSKRKTRGQ